MNSFSDFARLYLYTSPIFLFARYGGMLDAALNDEGYKFHKFLVFVYNYGSPLYFGVLLFLMVMGIIEKRNGKSLLANSSDKT